MQYSSWYWIKPCSKTLFLFTPYDPAHLRFSHMNLVLLFSCFPLWSITCGLPRILNIPFYLLVHALVLEYLVSFSRSWFLSRSYHSIWSLDYLARLWPFLNILIHFIACLLHSCFCFCCRIKHVHFLYSTFGPILLSSVGRGACHNNN